MKQGVTEWWRRRSRCNPQCTVLQCQTAHRQQQPGWTCVR